MHIKEFSIFEANKTPKGELTKAQRGFLDRWVDGTWRVNPQTGLVDVKGDVYMMGRRLKSFQGIKFGNVTGIFYCSNNQLTSLEGAPQKVWGFDCSRNQLTSLEGAPREVGGYFSCSNNKLTSWKGLPEISRDRIVIDENPTLEYLFSLDKKYEIDSSYYDDPLSGIV